MGSEPYLPELMKPSYLLHFHEFLSLILLCLAVFVLAAAVCGVLPLLWLGDGEPDRMSRLG